MHLIIIVSMVCIIDYCLLFYEIFSRLYNF